MNFEAYALHIFRGTQFCFIGKLICYLVSGHFPASEHLLKLNVHVIAIRITYIYKDMFNVGYCCEHFLC